MAAGRPDKYYPERCEEFVKMRANGSSVDACAAEWDIGRQSIYRWIEKYEDFRDAFTRGEAKYIKRLEDTLWKGLFDRDFKEGAFKFLAIRVGWSDKAIENRLKIRKHKDGFDSALRKALEDGEISPAAFDSIQSGLSKQWERENGEKAIKASEILAAENGKEKV